MNISVFMYLLFAFDIVLLRATVLMNLILLKVLPVVVTNTEVVMAPIRSNRTLKTLVLIVKLQNINCSWFLV